MALSPCETMRDLIMSHSPVCPWSCGLRVQLTESLIILTVPPASIQTFSCPQDIHLTIPQSGSQAHVLCFSAPCFVADDLPGNPHSVLPPVIHHHCIFFSFSILLLFSLAKSLFPSHRHHCKYLVRSVLNVKITSPIVGLLTLLSEAL